MSDDFLIYYNELTTDLEKLKQTNQQLLQAKYGNSFLDTCDDVIRQIRQDKDTVQLAYIEATQIKEVEARNKAKADLKLVEQELNMFEVQIGQLRSRKQLDYNVEQGNFDQVQEKPTDEQKLGMAVVFLEAGNQNMDDGLQNLDQVIVINNNITDMLQDDLQKLDRINDEVFGIQADVVLAKQQLRKLVQRVVNNKCYMALLFLIMAVVFGLTVWDLVKTVKKKTA